MRIFISSVSTVVGLLEALKSESFKDASLEVDSSYSSTTVEVWYDEGTNTVILK